MIVDAKQPLLTWALGQYVEWKLRRAFRGIWLDGALPDGNDGLLCYANHSSFWDGFVAHQLVRHADRDGYVVMEEQNLRRYRFFTRLGAMSIRRKDSQSALQTLRYARRVLQRPKAAVFLFPQGRIEANPPAPLRFERGVEVLARMSNVRCVPIAFRCAFFEHEYPDVLIRVGEPHPPELLAQMQSRLSGLVASLQAIDGVEGLRPLVRGRRSVAQRWDAARGLA